jgi:hypothetical protein
LFDRRPTSRVPSRWLFFFCFVISCSIPFFSGFVWMSFTSTTKYSSSQSFRDGCFYFLSFSH